jgi:DNA repair protein SbcC/Rad50
MIPLKLTLKGIYSYIEEQTIEFNDLTDSGLFGIFGSVGSGKSTILEAITFALYGETERLNSRDSRAYNMMNLKSNELLIDFEFYTDSDDIKYRFIVKGKRNRKKFDEVKAFERSSFILTPSVRLVGNTSSQPLKQTDEWIPTEKTAYDIIGLNYQNFKRTIIIPQGKFREFLELKATDRTNMLNEIFNLDRFDLAPKLTIIKTQNELKRNTLLAKMEQYQELNSEILKNKNDAETYLITQEKEERSELRKLQEDFLSLSQLKELFASLKKAELEFKAINQSADSFDKRKKSLDIYIDCRVKFSQLLTSEISLNKEINQKSLQLQQLKKHLDETKFKKNQLDGQLKQVKIIYDQKQHLIDETKELETIISIREAIKNKQILASRIEKGNLIINQQKLEYDQTQNTLQEQQLILSQLKEQLPDISELNNVKNFYIKQADLDKRLEEVTAESKSLSSEIQLLTDSFNNELKEQFSWAGDFKDKDKDKDKITEAAKEKINLEIVNFKKTKKKLNDKLNHILAQEKLKQWADELVDGENCPLCGSKEHPEILNITDLENEILAIKKQLESVEKDIALYNDFLSKIEKIEYKLNLVNKSLNKNTKEKEQKKQQLLTHKNNFSSNQSGLAKAGSGKDNHDLLDSIEQSIISAEKSNEKIKKIEKIISKKTSELFELQKNINKYSTAHQELKDQYTALDAGIENDVKKLKLLSLQQLESESDSSLINKSQSQKQKVKQAIEDFDSISLDLSKIQSKMDKTLGQIKTLTELLNEKNAAFNEVQKTLQDKLLNSQYGDLLEVVKILSNDLNEVEESQIISDFEAKLNIASKTLETLQIETKGKEFNQEMFLIIKSQISNKELLLKELSSKIGVIQSEIKKLKADLESKNKLNKKYNQLIKRKDNIQILSKLFKGQGFVRYISSVYLQNLSKSANERFFKMTRQQLQLEITQNNDFQVRDFLNEGKTRSVKTLSGGQMFQASLSLALALADSVQNQIMASHRFFFLDEGFGSLDNESLHIVFEALKSLKTENRIVGVISHVESLKQEIDVHLQVNKNDERGSLVHYSWI